MVLRTSVLILSFMLSCIIMLRVTNVARALPICVSKDECKFGIWCGDGSGGTCFHFSCQIDMDCRKLVRCNTPEPYCMKGICSC
ncbi:unnamed protein product [Thlaspi arvense]|uniref:Uncharacterized protein n=1 Tax=Thlaspi arvense TaxID=13288 RepID=A0AAU9RBY4_THLAR|nr:unnamed protein product [Thlaspi arvense]